MTEEREVHRLRVELAEIRVELVWTRRVLVLVALAAGGNFATRVLELIG